MPLISKRSVEEIRSRADITAFIGDYTNLRRAGSKWKGLSPFTNEKTPSFFVDPEKGFYYCFSTGQGGDIFKFLMVLENLTFAESVERVARRFGLTVEYEKGSGNADRSLRGVLFELHEFSTEYFRRKFEEAGPLAEKVREYWTRERGFDAETAHEFRIGFLPPDGSRAFAEALVKKGFAPRAIAAAGIFVGTSRTAEPTFWRSRFEARLIIPIRDIQGRVIAFTARKIPGITPDDGRGMNDAKYINSSETEIFHKGSTLFNIDRAKDVFSGKRLAAEPGGTAKARSVPFVLVEGQLDAIRSWICGIRTAVAGQGTGITDEQLHLLRRYSDRLDCLLDADAAGQKAALRLAPLAFRNGLELRFLSVPGGKDPDEFLSRNGAGGVSAILQSAVPAIVFIAKNFFPPGEKISAAQRQSALKEIFEILSASNSSVFQGECIRALAPAAGTEQLPLSHDFERFLAAKRNARRSREDAAPVASETSENQEKIVGKTERNDLTSAEGALLFLALNHDDVALSLAEVVPPDWIDSEKCAGRILSRILAEISEGEWHGSETLHDLLETDEERECVAQLQTKFDRADGSAVASIDELERKTNECLARLCKDAYARERCEIDSRVAALPPNSPERLALMRRKIEMRENMKNPPQIALRRKN